MCHVPWIPILRVHPTISAVAGGGCSSSGRRIALGRWRRDGP